MNKLYDKISICFVLSHSFKEKLEIFIEADQIQIYDCKGRKKKKKKSMQFCWYFCRYHIAIRHNSAPIIN